jgi:hypothetical protein
VAEKHREEVLNVVLATCLSGRGIEADPETILRRGRSRPDVIALFRGLRCGIEGNVADANQAKSVVLEDARERINQGIAHLAVAVEGPTGDPRNWRAPCATRRGISRLSDIFPDYAAPIVRNQDGGRELTMARWGMPYRWL